VTWTEFELETREDPVFYETFDLNGNGKMLANFSVLFCGWSLRNLSASTLATLDIYDGTDASGTSIFPVTLQSNESSREWFYPGGVLFKNGIYVNVTAQEVKGAVLFRRHPGQTRGYP